MWNMIYVLIVCVQITIFFRGATAYLCHVCAVSTQATCTAATDCGAGNGCYSQTWVTGGVRYYEKGCHIQSVRNCYDFKDKFCNRNDTLYCCDVNYCNSVNPAVNWKPEIPKNFQVSYVTSSSVTLKWDIQCNGLYTYQLWYSKQGGVAQTIQQIPGQIVIATGLESNTEYIFTLRSYYDGESSDGVTVARTTNINTSNSGNRTYCTFATNVSLIELSSKSTTQQCNSADDVCFSRSNHWKMGDIAFWTKGCVSKSVCAQKTGLNSASCQPGYSGSSCTHCCEGVNCNKGDISSDFTCNNVSVEDRLDCGWSGVSLVECLFRGCCYKEADAIYNKWCYHPKYLVPRTTSTTSAPSVTAAGLDYWIIIVIVLALLILILLVALIAYCVITKRKERKRGFYECENVYAFQTTVITKVKQIIAETKQTWQYKRDNRYKQPCNQYRRIDLD